MKKIVFLISSILALAGCSDTNMASYMKRHHQNYKDNNIIDMRNPFQTNYQNQYHIPEKQYDAEDFRAGAFAVCGDILKKTNRDICQEVSYWGDSGPRL